MISIRRERHPDVAAREALLDDAFGGQRWRKSSQRLRNGRSPAEGLAFIAMDGKRIVGTARLWDVVSGTGKPALLLGPVAVASDYRNRGIGAALVRRALGVARRQGHRAGRPLAHFPWAGGPGRPAETVPQGNRRGTGLRRLPGRGA